MKEQKLVDLCFSLVLTATDPQYIKHFGKLSTEQKAEWVRKQLEGCAIHTEPCGSSWGVLC